MRADSPNDTVGLLQKRAGFIETQNLHEEFWRKNDTYLKLTKIYMKNFGERMKLDSFSSNYNIAIVCLDYARA
jgi:hypothetical protein